MTTDECKSVVLRRNQVVMIKSDVNVVNFIAHSMPVTPFIGNHLDLIHGNAFPHIAKTITDYLCVIGVLVLEWRGLN